MNLINTDNYYIEEDEMPNFEQFEKVFPDLKDSCWHVISEGEMKKKIVCVFHLWFYDYTLFKYFHEYESFVPGIRQGSLNRSVLTRGSNIEPDDLLEFFNYFEPYFDANFDRSDYFWSVYSVSDNKYLGCPVLCNINSERVKIKTVHTTYTDEIEHKDFYELKGMNFSAPSKWIKIEEGKILDTDKKNLVIKKMYHKDHMVERIQNIKKMCSLAISLDVKIKRNYEW